MNTITINNLKIHPLKTVLSLLLLFAFSFNSFAQDTLYNKHIDDLNILELKQTNTGTIPLYRLDTVQVASAKLMTAEEKKAYRKLKYNIIKVYPYAQRALTLIGEIERVTEESKRKKEKRKYLKELEKEMKEDFKTELKKLTTSQGKVLVKLIERGSDERFYDLLKEFKNPVSAFFWQALGKSFGYNFKEGYDPAEYADMEYLLHHLESNGVKALGYSRHPRSKALEATECIEVETLLDKDKKKKKTNASR
ncbi:MAG: DUF4294 domain-containing protein [Chitinophagales bacterium]